MSGPASQTTEDWLPIDSAPHDGTPVWLLFREGRQYVKGPDKRRLDLPEREVVGSWWSSERTHKRLGKRSKAGMRGARIERDGGYWGLVKKSVPLSGLPVAWRPLSESEKIERKIRAEVPV